MTIMVHDQWHKIGQFTDGSPVLAVAVFDGDRMIGRVVDLTDGQYRADYLNLEGEVEGTVLPDYYTAVVRVADEAQARQRRLH